MAFSHCSGDVPAARSPKAVSRERSGGGRRHSPERSCAMDSKGRRKQLLSLCSGFCG